MGYYALKLGELRYPSNFLSVKEQERLVCGLGASENCTLLLTEAKRTLAKVEMRQLPHNPG